MLVCAFASSFISFSHRPTPVCFLFASIGDYTPDDESSRPPRRSSPHSAGLGPRTDSQEGFGQRVLDGIPGNQIVYSRFSVCVSCARALTWVGGCAGVWVVGKGWSGFCFCFLWLDKHIDCIHSFPVLAPNLQLCHGLIVLEFVC